VQPAEAETDTVPSTNDQARNGAAGTDRTMRLDPGAAAPK
jgi:hypothetical protein